ncbi:uncharacterized protein J8A68_002629, partial [[Candida] subhashii]
ANLQTKLDNSLLDILKTSGIIFEILNNNKSQSNLLTGPNNQLITPTITNQLQSQISKFDEILDETLSKFNDAKWCIEQMLENKQRQEELKLKEEMEKQRRLKEEEERKIKEEQERILREQEEKRKKEEEEAKAKAAAAAAAKAKAEEEVRLKREQAEREQEQERQRQQKQRENEEQKRQQELQKQQEEQRKQQEAAAQQQQQQQQKQQSFSGFDEFISPGFDLGELSNTNQNPSDILSSMNFNDLNLDMPTGAGSGNDNNDEANALVGGLENNGDDMDLDMNNLLGTDESILDGLNMSLLDSGMDGTNNAPMPNDDEFDVDNFLNQFGGND